MGRKPFSGAFLTTDAAGYMTGSEVYARRWLDGRPCRTDFDSQAPGLESIVSAVISTFGLGAVTRASLRPLWGRGHRGTEMEDAQ